MGEKWILNKSVRALFWSESVLFGRVRILYWRVTVLYGRKKVINRSVRVLYLRVSKKLLEGEGTPQ